MTTEELAAIEARANAATEGPWYPRATDDGVFMNARYVSTQEGAGWQHDNLRGMDPGNEAQDERHVVAITMLQSPRLADISDEKWDENTEFIAHARADIPALLGYIRALAAERDAMRDVVASARNLIPYALDGTMDYDGWQVLIRLNVAVKALEAP